MIKTMIKFSSRLKSSSAGKSGISPASLKGYVDVPCSSDFHAMGWVLKRTDGIPEIDIYINGKCKGQAFAEGVREDLVAAGLEQGRSFCIPLTPYFDQGTNTIDLRFSGTKESIPNGSKTLALKKYDGQWVDAEASLEEFERRLRHANEIITCDGDSYHQIFQDYLTRNNQAGKKVLEIGSRNVSGNTQRDRWPNCRYTGFDVLAGENVDVVGDVHEISKYLPADEYDSVYSISVFEHLLMPWKAVIEINRVMKVGGEVFVQTHPTWPTHELPWDFWRYMKNGFHALFNKYTGFEIEILEEGLPCRIISMVADSPTRGLCDHTSNLAVAVTARKIGPPHPGISWDVPLHEIVDTMYPSKSE